MQNKIKLLSVDAILLLAVLLSGCSEQDVPPNDPNSELNSILHNSSISENYTNNSDSTNDSVQSSLTESLGEQSVTESRSLSDKMNSSENLRSITINEDVMWGIGKNFDEITERYGDVTAGNYNEYTFENGFGKYVWDDSGMALSQTDRNQNIEIIKGHDGCKTIADISASDFLIGDISILDLDNFASECGFEVIPLNPTNDPFSDTLYDGYRFAYYTHPSYENITFSMCYKESGFDEDATFRISYDDML